MGNTVGQITTVLTAIVGVAILAVLVSRNSQTPAVVKSFGDAFSGSLRAATSPVTGGGFGNAQF
jgi:hypothetical protein